LDDERWTIGVRLGRGGVHRIGLLQTMTAKDIRWSVLQDEFDAELFRLAAI
jgi:hypothetical protein